jgi:hypothetical protein
MQSGNRPQVYAGHGTHGIPAYGYGKSGCGMGAAQDRAAGKRNPQIDAKGGESMTDAQLDAIKEAEDARIWEELNKEDPATQKAVDLLTKAVALLEQVEQLVQDAAEAVENTPETDRVASLNIDAEELEIAVRTQIERMK